MPGSNVTGCEVGADPPDTGNVPPPATILQCPKGNLHEGKIGVLCLAPSEGLGIEDPELRERIGEDRITLFRRHGA